jgi:hypothetical protein
MGMESKIPVVFIHTGQLPAYLGDAIAQAQSFNNDVVLITDHKIIPFKADLVNVDSVNPDESDFKSYYKHMSTNSYAFEYICIYRWFLLKNYMERHKVDRVLYLDSDVYLYGNTVEIAKHYPEFGFGYNLPLSQEEHYWAGSAPCSIWTLASLTDFCNFIKTHYTSEAIKVLEEKWEHHRNNTIPGGVCDMTFLYLFSGTDGFFNLGKVHNGCSFDFNDLTPDNYQRNEYAFKLNGKFKRETKDIRFIDDLPYCRNLVSGEQVRFFALTEYAKLVEISKTYTLAAQLKNRLYRIKKSLGL